MKEVAVSPLKGARNGESNFHDTKFFSFVSDDFRKL